MGSAREFPFAEQGGLKPYSTIADSQTEFGEAGDNFFLHLTGHSWLPGAAVLRSMRVGVRRERSVRLRRLVESDAVAHAVVELADFPDDLRSAPASSAQKKFSSTASSSFETICQ